ncbi:MAG: L-lactate dehydrogenase [Bifidobacterium sp.]|jgi:L-lactate dehydrogenase|nr:L-lactate dehydrogenase [Bifidobacterium sp.]
MTAAPVKIGIVGVGHVGPHVANSLIMQGIADEIHMCDVNRRKLASEVQDLNDSVAFAPHRVRVFDCGDEYERLASCDIIINSAGHVTLAGTNRDGELYAGVRIARTFVGRIAAAGFDGFWIDVSNPNDVVTREIQRLSGLPPQRVMGTGTCLDSARLVSVISLATGIAPQSICAYMIGEHGFSEIAAWSHLTIGGVPLARLEAVDPDRYGLDRAEYEKRALQGGYVSYAGKHCTEYAIANSAARIARAIVHNERAVLPVSAQLDGQYGKSGFYISTPAVIGNGGVEEIYELDLPHDELEGFLNSCAKVEENYARIPELSVARSRTNPVVIAPDPDHDDEYARGLFPSDVIH